MKIIELDIQGCYEIQNFYAKDDRGFFVKTFHQDFFQENGLESNFRESYYSLSSKDVIRGMHFQAPPDDHHKLVYCVQGKVLDVILDLRKDSPTFKQTLPLRIFCQSSMPHHNTLLLFDTFGLNVMWLPCLAMHQYYLERR